MRLVGLTPLYTKLRLIQNARFEIGCRGGHRVMARFLATVNKRIRLRDAYYYVYGEGMKTEIQTQKASISPPKESKRYV